jgi:uncharacterized membrane protein YgdD (TMEM256/DUF423 family)
MATSFRSGRSVQMTEQSMTDVVTTDHTLRWAIVVAGLIGAAGVAMAAAGAHGGDPHLLGTASTICFAHAPALLALGLAGRQVRLAQLGAALLALGTALFAGDLTMRAFFGERLFPMAAPIGGSTTIIAWLVIAIGALLPRRRN